LRPVAERIWEIVSKQPSTINQVYRQCSVCELKVYRVINELLLRNQIAFN
jgi:hypothetical protein